MIEKNYHTHTYRCKHAQGDCQEYVTEALQAGCTTLGFSEHMPLPNDRWTHVISKHMSCRSIYPVCFIDGITYEKPQTCCSASVRFVPAV